MTNICLSYGRGSSNVVGMDVERKNAGAVEREFVASLARGLAVVRAFSKDAREMTLSEVAQKTGLTRAAARRFLLTLEALGYVAIDGRRFRLTPKVLDLGFSYLSSMDLWDVAMPYMEEVSATIHESCSASVLEGCDIVYVARVPTKRIMSVALSIGARLPAIATSMGRVLLAQLDDDALQQHLGSCPVRAHTAHTVTDPAALRDHPARGPTAGLVPGRSGAGGGPDLDRGAGAQQARPGAGGDERQHPCQPQDRRRGRQSYLPVLDQAARRIGLALP